MDSDFCRHMHPTINLGTLCALARALTMRQAAALLLLLLALAHATATAATAPAQRYFFFQIDRLSSLLPLIFPTLFAKSFVAVFHFRLTHALHTRYVSGSTGARYTHHLSRARSDTTNARAVVSRRHTVVPEQKSKKIQKLKTEVKKGHEHKWRYALTKTLSCRCVCGGSWGAG
jgi:hypothetical protein